MTVARFPLTLNELRDIQTRRLDDADVRALLWEVKRLKDLIRLADEHRQSIEKVWKEEVGGHMVGIWELRVLLSNEVGSLPAKPGYERESAAPSRPSTDHPSGES